MEKRKILYVDMDNVLVDFQSGIDRLDRGTRDKYDGRLDDAPGIFALMLPMKDAVESFIELSRIFDTYICLGSATNGQLDSQLAIDSSIFADYGEDKKNT